jgi:hypothetical protein
MGSYLAQWVGRLVILSVYALIQAIQWIKDYRKIQRDYDNNMEAQLEGLKYKNKKNKQKGNNKNQ